MRICCSPLGHYSMPPAPGYPLTGCSPAEPVSVSPGKCDRNGLDAPIFDNCHQGTCGTPMAEDRWRPINQLLLDRVFIPRFGSCR
jgi:hypothetical protein